MLDEAVRIMIRPALRNLLMHRSKDGVAMPVDPPLGCRIAQKFPLMYPTREPMHHDILSFSDEMLIGKRQVRESAFEQAASRFEAL